MSASTELQRAVYHLLTASAEMQVLVGGRVYDGMPDVGQYPCITFGAADFEPDDADCIDARAEALTLHAWSRDQGRTYPCKRIVSAAYDALHEMPFTMTDPYALAEMRVTQARVFLDTDGITAHGVIQIKAQVERV